MLQVKSASLFGTIDISNQVFGKFKKMLKSYQRNQFQRFNTHGGDR